VLMVVSLDLWRDKDSEGCWLILVSDIDVKYTRQLATVAIIETLREEWFSGSRTSPLLSRDGGTYTSFRLRTETARPFSRKHKRTQTSVLFVNANGTLQLDSVTFVTDECTRLIRNNYSQPSVKSFAMAPIPYSPLSVTRYTQSAP